MSKNGINNITLPVYKEAIETVKGMIPGFQTTFAIAKSLLINLSGWNLTNFKVVDVSTAQYTIKKIVNASDDSILSEKRAKDYLKAMTGSEYLPKYSYEKPTYTYIIAENVIWKVQYDSQQGLLMYKMIELPTSTGTKLYRHDISFIGLQTINQGNQVLKQCDLVITIISNQQQPYFNNSMADYEVAEALSMLLLNKNKCVYASYHYTDNKYEGNYGDGTSIDLLQSQLGVFLKGGSYSYQNISFECTNCSYTTKKENVSVL